MPSEMFERGQQDAHAGARHENYYHYYYDYKLGFEAARRKLRRRRRRQAVRRVGRLLLRLLPLLLLMGGATAWFRYQASRARTPAPLAAQPSSLARDPRVLPPMSPAPSPTLAPTGTPASAPPSARTLEANGFAVITGTTGVRLRVRQAPGTQQPIVARVAEGTVVKVLEGPAQANGLQWWRIEVAGRSGWCAAPFLQPASPP